MNKFVKFLTNIKLGTKKHSPEILTGLGIAGFIGTVIETVRATQKAVKAIEDEKERQDIEEGTFYDSRVKVRKLTKKEVFNLCWKYYIPTTVTGVTSIACIIGSSAIHTKRNAAIATAYSISESAFRAYKDKVIETLGEKKHQAITDEVAKDTVTKNPPKSTEVIVTNSGDMLCYDNTSGRYFKSSVDKIKKVENELNRQMLSDMYVSLNDLYYELGLSSTKFGDELGWNVNKALIDIRFSSQLAEDNTPCLVIDFDVSPSTNYQYV